MSIPESDYTTTIINGLYGRALDFSKKVTTKCSRVHEVAEHAYSKADWVIAEKQQKELLDCAEDALNVLQVTVATAEEFANVRKPVSCGNVSTLKHTVAFLSPAREAVVRAMECREKVLERLAKLEAENNLPVSVGYYWWRESEEHIWQMVNVTRYNSKLAVKESVDGKGTIFTRVDYLQGQWSNKIEKPAN